MSTFKLLAGRDLKAGWALIITSINPIQALLLISKEIKPFLALSRNISRKVDMSRQFRSSKPKNLFVGMCLQLLLDPRPNNSPLMI